MSQGTSRALPALPEGHGEVSPELFYDYHLDLKFTELETAVKAVETTAAESLNGTESAVTSFVVVVVSLAIREVISRTFQWIKSHWT